MHNKIFVFSHSWPVLLNNITREYCNKTICTAELPSSLFSQILKYR